MEDFKKAYNHAKQSHKYLSKKYRVYLAVKETGGIFDLSTRIATEELYPDAEFQKRLIEGDVEDIESFIMKFKDDEAVSLKWAWEATQDAYNQGYQDALEAIIKKYVSIVANKGVTK